MRATRTIAILGLVLWGAGALGQTCPDDTVTLDWRKQELCANDFLYLVSPEVVDMELQEQEPGSDQNVRFGLMLSWDDLALEDATCFTLRGVDTLDLDIEAQGGFGDNVDRLLRFTVQGQGAIGADQPDRLRLGWRNQGPSTYGNLAGFINLANNGGVVAWDAAAGAWTKRNDGLPVTWRQVNVLDLAIAADGVMYVGLSSGETTSTTPRGLWRHTGAGWARVGADVITDAALVTCIAVDPANSDHVVVGTQRLGAFLSTDGGQTWAQWAGNLDPTVEEEESYRVTAVNWTGARVVVAVRTFGLFVSEDNGVGFARINLQVPDDLDKLNPTFIDPQVNQVVTDPNNGDRLLACLQYHGVYESTDGGLSWTDHYGDLLVPNPDDNGAWVRSALSVAVDPGDPQTMVMAVEQWGLYRTTNGGTNWTLVGEPVQPDAGLLRRMEVVSDPATPGRFLSMESAWGLLVSDDYGATWSQFPDQPTLNTALALAVRPGGDGGNFLVGTWQGGIYVPGTSVALSETYSTETSPDKRGLDLGLDLVFHGGNLSDHEADPDVGADTFDLVGQTFQGWCVWRTTIDRPDTMTLIGKYDRVNPESCIEGFCGDLNYQPVPQCYHTTRAGCFELDEEAGRIRFFDDEVYNAFRYYYAVTTFDYGNTAETTPQNLARDMIFSPRYPGDAESPFSQWPWCEGGNRRYRPIDRAQQPVVGGEGIYVFPNPLRNDAGIPGEEGRTVVFTNLPPGARVRVFTSAGDDVVDLGPDNLTNGNIRWPTWNRHQEPVAAGVYLYKVEVPGREDHWGRLVIIR